MPVYSLDDELIFPHPILREPDGLMAVGGDLSPERLLLAYRWGIFPWYHEGQPILWWWLAPRLMVRPENVHISHSVRNFMNQRKYKVTFDKEFKTVMERCGNVSRPGQEGTWIMPEMIDAYSTLHKMGYAHSVEVWQEGSLVGGLYGIALGKIFFGESMFTEKPNASKVGFVHLAQYLASNGFQWIDCQQDTPHMRTLGADLVEEEDFLNILRNNQSFIKNPD
ncbi:MAG: leucyl/phenylalanyl-tRNA--protein transferase [Saprospiraceae bacterium]|nr:leucyl/phenylalanyl-tRNA--protein transferase [Saprospiraceae bacterium]